MAHISADRVADTTTTTGTGDITLANSAPSGFRTLNAVAVATDTFFYTVAGQTSTEWEVGLGTYSGTHVFVRTTVLASSNADAAVNFTTGTKDFFITLPALRTATTAAAFGTDNVLIRSDGTGKGVQSTGVTVGDSNDVSGIRSIALPTIPTQGYDAVTNLNLVVSAAAGALTIAIKGVDGNDPSATNAIDIPFRSATATEGKPVWRTLSAASSLVISSGSTLGVTSSTAFRLVVVLFDDAGTLRLGVINATAIGIDESAVASSTTEGGAGGADSANVWYTGTGATSKAFRVLGFLQWNDSGLTAGTWTTSNLVTVQLMGPGINIQPGPFVTTYTTGSGTYTTPAGTKSLLVEVVGGGGGGGGGANASTFAGGGGGGAGGYVRKRYFVPAASYAYAAGAGGAGGAGGNPGATGSTGTNSTFGALTASGGLGGSGGSPAGVLGTGGTGGPASGGDVNIVGAAGGGGANGTSSTGGCGGTGGSSPYGGAGVGGSNSAGTAGTSGSGGGGASNNNTGGAGGTGYIVVTAFFN